MVALATESRASVLNCGTVLQETTDKRRSRPEVEHAHSKTLITSSLQWALRELCHGVAGRDAASLAAESRT